MLQAEFAWGDQIYLEKSVEPELAAEMCAVQFFDRFAKPPLLVDICGVARLRLRGEGIQY